MILEDEELQDLANIICLKGETRDFNDEPITMAEAAAVLGFCEDQIKSVTLDPKLKEFYQNVKDVILKDMVETIH